MTAPQRGPAGEWSYLACWRGDDVMDLGATLAALPVDDLSATRVIMAEREGWLHYADEVWHVWDGTCHRPDDSGEIGKIVLNFAGRMQQMLTEARQQVASQIAMKMRGAGSDETGKETDKEWEKWLPGLAYAKKLRGNAGMNALAGCLAKAAGCSPADLTEHHPTWLNFASGTVDLVTGWSKPHDPADMITYCLPLAYRPELAGQCPLFCGMVHRMCGGNSAVADYVLRVLGYALIGENPEQLIFFLNGPTKSGKTQVLYIVRQLLGVLAEDSKADLITRMPNGRNARVENSVRGKRLVTINETSESMQIDEGQLKRLTGEPMIAVDKHYADSRIKTAESWAIICGNNEMPSVSSMDSAVRERMVVVPCGDTIPVEQRDQHLAARIIATEGEAILALLVGCASRYFREKLPRPAEVDAATEKYCRDQESVAAFAAEACVIVRPAAGRPVAHVGMAEAYRFYLGWCRDNNKTAPLGPHAFSEKMSAVPGILREDNGGSVRRYSGVSWNEEYLRRRTGVFY